MGSPKFLSSPLFNIGFMLASMQLAKKVDWENPHTLFVARTGYYGAQVLVMIMTYMLMTLIRKKNDTTVLTYVNKAKPSFGGGAGGQDETVTTTVMEYDISQLKQFLQSTVTSILMISVMHWQFKFTQPLLLQSILPIKNLVVHKEALIHLWGDAPEGALQRPFPAENPLGAMMGALGGETAVEETHEKKD
ncbi:inorganic phosphate transporter [Spinellus fusiger]|nr:inorganic phosphate transporter [Spinellus fusiger]